jgi:hypothetical protein
VSIFVQPLITEITKLLNVNLVTVLVVDVPDQLMKIVLVVVHLHSYIKEYVDIPVQMVTMVNLIHSMNVSHVTLLV